MTTTTSNPLPAETRSAPTDVPNTSAPNVVPSVLPSQATVLASAGANPTKPSLAEIDKALADNLDVMLQSKTPIDENLSEELDQKSAPVRSTSAEPTMQTVQQPKSSAVIAPPQDETATPITVEMATAESRETIVEQDQSLLQASPPQDVVLRASDDVANQEQVAVVSAAANAPPAPEPVAANQPIEQSTAQPSAAMSAAAAPPATFNSPKSEPQVHIPIGVGTPAVIDVSPVEAPSTQHAKAAARQITLFWQFLLNLLALINSPLRKVPAPFRPAMNWLAISLVLWVPVVWVVAVISGGAAGNVDVAAPTSHDGEATNAHAIVHEASGLKHH